ncbi:helix-turn-helix protein [Pseudonocardia hierapolitana]|uniref:Helix-turn-helix protein n=1 Tax=Pseudonocardia hierapolitana TaxID=1128676 RepID=A0A561T165_9PSEU|nr:helix-turn-helix protein [Pseudonocardia hierapolitana]
MVVVRVTGCAARRRELGACLRSYRRLVAPEQVGLPAGGRRRTPGLRREEVATLAGVGLSWYTWLEQGRVTASGHVLESVGRVLGLDGAGRRHLRLLSAPAEPPPATPPAADLVPLLADFAGPAAVLDHRLDIVAANPRWTRVWGEPRDVDPARRNVLWQLAAGPPAVPVDDPGPLMTALRRQFRMAANLYAGDERIAEVAELLRADAPAYTPLWECRGIGAFGEPTVVVAGRELRAHLLEPAGRPGSALLFLAAADERGA